MQQIHLFSQNQSNSVISVVSSKSHSLESVGQFTVTWDRHSRFCLSTTSSTANVSVSLNSKFAISFSKSCCFQFFPTRLTLREISKTFFGLSRKNPLSTVLKTTNYVPVVAIFWARVPCRLALEDACFRMRINLGVVLIRSLVCSICVPGRLRSSSRVALK